MNLRALGSEYAAVVLVVLGAVTTSPPVEKITPTGVWRDDRSAELHERYAADPAFQSVGAHRTDGQTHASVVLITDRFALSSRHQWVGDGGLIGGEEAAISFGDSLYSVDRLVPHPSADVALVLLDRPVSHVSAARRISDHPLRLLGREITLVGFGAAGPANGEPLPPGRKIAGTNVLDLWSVEQDADLLWYDLDSPGDPEASVLGGPEPTDLEIVSQGGDSGGGIFVRTEAGWGLIGIIGGGFVPFPHGAGAETGEYGTYAWDFRGEDVPALDRVEHQRPGLIEVEDRGMGPRGLRVCAPPTPRRASSSGSRTRSSRHHFGWIRP